MKLWLQARENSYLNAIKLATITLKEVDKHLWIYDYKPALKTLERALGSIEHLLRKTTGNERIEVLISEAKEQARLRRKSRPTEIMGHIPLPVKYTVLAPILDRLLRTKEELRSIVRNKELMKYFDELRTVKRVENVEVVIALIEVEKGSLEARGLWRDYTVKIEQAEAPQQALAENISHALSKDNAETRITALLPPYSLTIEIWSPLYYVNLSANRERFLARIRTPLSYEDIRERILQIAEALTKALQQYNFLTPS